MCIKVNKNYVFLLISFAICTEVAFRLNGVPIITGDAVWFYPVAENFSQYKSLIHPLMSPISDGGGPLVWHGWVHPYLIGLVGRLFFDPFLGVTISETIMVGLGCIIFAWIIVSSESDTSIFITASVTISVLVMAFSFFGRPESIAFVFLVAGLATLQYLEKRPLRLGSIVVFWGGVGATQPTVALLVGPILLGYFISSSSSPRSALFKWVMVGAMSVSFTLLLTVVLYPYSPVEWIEGLWMHSQKITDRGDSSRLLYYFMLQPSRFMQGGWFVLAAICGALLLWQYESTRDWWLLGVALIGVWIAWYTSIRVPPTRYNLFATFPLFAAFIYYTIDKLDGQKINIFVKSTVLLLGLCSVLIFGRRYIVLGRSLLGSDRNDVIRSVEALPDRSKVYVDKSILFSSYMPDEWVDFKTLGSKLPDKDNGKYAIIKQSALGSLTPPEIEGYRILEESFNSEPIYFGPLKIANTDDSYNFAIYKRVE